MILLTGASGGIGEQLLPKLTQLDKIIGIYNKKKPNTKKNEEMTFAKVDLTSSNDIGLFIKEYNKILKNITLVHCAVVKIDNLLAHFDEENWQK